MSHLLFSRVPATLIQKSRAALVTAAVTLLCMAQAAAQCVTVEQVLQPPQPGGALSFAPHAIAVYGDAGEERVYAVGYNGQLARTSDYSSWESLTCPVTNVNSMATFGGELVVGGSPGVMAWNGTTWRTLAGLNTSTDGQVSKLAVLQNKLIAIGAFSVNGDSVRNRVAIWNGAAWAAVEYSYHFLPATDMCVYGTKIAVVGGFDSFNGSPANGVAFYDGLGWSVPTPGGPQLAPFNGAHHCAAVGNYLYVSDEFLPVPAVTRWNGTAWETLASPPMLANDMLYWSAAAYNGSYVLSGAGMIEGSGVPVYAVAFDGTSWSTLAEFRGVSSRQILSITEFGGELLFGGIFDTASGVDSPFIVRWNGTTMLRAAGGTAAPDSLINALCPSGAELIIGGEFVQLNGAPATNIASYDGVTFKTLGLGTNGAVRALKATPTETYVGGAFTQADGNAAHGIAAWDGANWTTLGSGVNEGISGGTTPRVNAIETLGTDIFVAGLFTNAGTLQSVGNIARWDGGAWHALGSGMNAEVTGLTVFNGDLIAVGYFTNAGGVAATNVARWNGTAWSALGHGQLFRAAATLGTELFAASRDGVFGVYRWDGAAWQPDTVAFQPKFVRELFNDGGRLFAIGSTNAGTIHLFQRISAGNWLDVADARHASANDSVAYRGGLTQWNGSLYSGSPLPAIDSALTRYTFSGAPPHIVNQPHDASVFESQPITLEVDTFVDGYAYQWFKDGVLLTGQTSRILSIASAVASDQGHYYVVITSPCGVTQSNTVLVTVGALCAEDINQNRRVDLADLARLLASFGNCTGDANYEPRADFDASGCVDLADLGRLLSVYGSVCQ